MATPWNLIKRDICVWYHGGYRHFNNPSLLPVYSVPFHRAITPRVNNPVARVLSPCQLILFLHPSLLCTRSGDGKPSRSPGQHHFNAWLVCLLLRSSCRSTKPAHPVPRPGSFLPGSGCPVLHEALEAPATWSEPCQAREGKGSYSATTMDFYRLMIVTVEPPCQHSVTRQTRGKGIQTDIFVRQLV
jgi:hypothetical protein